MEPVHVPAWQVSVWVQASPSEHAEPFGAVGFEHNPVPGLHVPARWHWSLAVQVTGLEPVHVPDWQVSVWVHAFPSLQVVPLGRGEASHASEVSLQTPMLHALV